MQFQGTLTKMKTEIGSPIQYYLVFEGDFIHINQLLDKKISIYVLGDDFQPGGSIRGVLQTIERINRTDADGNRLVRIHGIGFPTIFSGPVRFQQSAYRYSTLMREMTHQNGGTFVGLNDFR